MTVSIENLDTGKKKEQSVDHRLPREVQNLSVVGKPVRKVDAMGMATGRTRYTGDMEMPGMLYGSILTSPHAHARIIKIDADKARALPGVAAVLTYEDVPRTAETIHTTAGQGYPEPSAYDTWTLDKKVRYVGDRVAAVAAETPQILAQALKLIHVEYEVLEPILDPRKAMEPGAPIIHDEEEARMIIPVPYDKTKNLAAAVEASAGNVEDGLTAADVVVDAEYETQYSQHCPIEPHVALAYLDENDRVIIITSTQVPFHARRITAQALGIPLKRIRVIKPRIGGGFGAKQEVLIEDITAALAMATRKPVLLEYNRSEEFISSRTRHPQIIRMRTGTKRDGSLTAMDLDILMNTGAYGSHALTVVCNSGSKTLPIYRCKDLHFRGQTVYTNLPVGGAYRGYGVTQAAFALECNVDDMACAIGMDPLEWRRKNHILLGEGSPIFEALGEGKPGVRMTMSSMGLAECMEQGANAIGWKEKRGKPGTGRFRRGVGMAALMQGSSIPQIDMGAATIKMNEDGSFNLLVGATDLGTGSDTILAQCAAQVLGLRTEDIIVTSSDTDITPFDVGAYASSTTYLSGMAVKKAAEDAANQVRGVAAKMMGSEFDPAELKLENGRAIAPNGKSVSLAEVGTHSLYEADQFQICGKASHVTEKSPPPFSAQFAEVEVDMETGKVRIIKYVAAVDCGTALNPALAEGQIEGAVANGIGYALYEEYLFNPKGRMLNDSFRHYKIPTTRDMPEMVTILVPTYEPTGPFGAKSVSEIGINGPLPAISNAILDATGARLRQAPFTPERVLAAIKG